MGNDLRDRFVALATSYVGTGAKRGGNPPGQMYGDLVAANESDVARRGMVTASGCALVVRGLFRAIGMRDPRLEAPYATGSAVATVIDMAREAGALHSSADAMRAYMADLGAPGSIQSGDVYYLGGQFEHVGIIANMHRDFDEDEDPTWYTIDGGERDLGGAQLIRSQRRTVHLPDMMSKLDGATYARPVLGIVDLDALAARFTAGA